MYARNAESQRQVSRMDRKEAIKEAEIQIDVYKSMILYNKDFEPKNDNSNYERKIEFLKVAIAALQEPEIVHCKDCKYWIDDYPYSDKVKKCELAGYMVGENGYCVYGKVEE